MLSVVVLGSYTQVVFTSNRVHATCWSLVCTMCPHLISDSQMNMSIADK